MPAPTPTELPELTAALGISSAGLRGLTEAHGDRVTEVLQRRWRRLCREHPRFLGAAPVAPTEGRRQRLSAAQELGYTDTTFNAVDPLEALDKADQKALSNKANADWDQYTSVHKPQEFLARELRSKAEKVRKLKARAIRESVDVRAEYDSFISALEAKLCGAAIKEAA